MRDALQIHKTRLEKQFEQRVNAEIRRRIAAADDAVRASYSKLSKENLICISICNAPLPKGPYSPKPNSANCRWSATPTTLPAPTCEQKCCG